jgi:hypothetical protein
VIADQVIVELVDTAKPELALGALVHLAKIAARPARAMLG